GFQRLGIAVPHDISVAGFGDVPVASDLTPALTTVRLPLEQVGQQAVDLAISPDPPVRRSVAFEGVVMLRDSTAAPHA
ncbi:substrate-binding domain-containing protein, partial [Pseudactinotalea sp.]|uniref:substrate-binding domain-containing protein n=1 Tax=Pseudactinotalea sp. TaxID=1926260 RepID=UPI003B3A503D